MMYEIFSQGWAQEQELWDTLCANDCGVKQYLGVINCDELDNDSAKIIVARRDPVTAVLEAYSQEGHTQALSPAMFGERVKQYMRDAAYNIQLIRAKFPDTRTLYTEDHTKPRHWAASLGLTQYGLARHTEIAIPNRDELQELCERDLATTIAEYKSVI